MEEFFWGCYLKSYLRIGGRDYFARSEEGVVEAVGWHLNKLVIVRDYETIIG